MTRRENHPRREPGRRGPPPEGIPLKGRRAKIERPVPARAIRTPTDPVICRGAGSYESADFLQQSAEGTKVTSEALGFEPLFGVSGWIVFGVKEPLPEGYAWGSTLSRAGFRVLNTPYLGRPGHVTIMLRDPVDDDQSARLNYAFGREP